MKKLLLLFCFSFLLSAESERSWKNDFEKFLMKQASSDPQLGQVTWVQGEVKLIRALVNDKAYDQALAQCRERVLIYPSETSSAVFLYFSALVLEAILEEAVYSHSLQIKTPISTVENVFSILESNPKQSFIPETLKSFHRFLYSSYASLLMTAQLRDKALRKSLPDYLEYENAMRFLLSQHYALTYWPEERFDLSWHHLQLGLLGLKADSLGPVHPSRAEAIKALASTDLGEESQWELIKTSFMPSVFFEYWPLN